MIDKEVMRWLNDLLMGRSTACGEFTLVHDGVSTTTTVTRKGMSSNSVISTQALSALASNSDITRIVPAKDQFVVTHPASANIRTFRYSFLTGVA